jgi:hypothetical protein
LTKLKPFATSQKLHIARLLFVYFFRRTGRAIEIGIEWQRYT